MTQTQTPEFPCVPYDGQWRWRVTSSALPRYSRLKLQQKGRLFWQTVEWTVLPDADLNDAYEVAWVTKWLIRKAKPAATIVRGTFPVPNCKDN